MLKLFGNALILWELLQLNRSNRVFKKSQKVVDKQRYLCYYNYRDKEQ